MANETVLFKRGDSATITSTPVTDGQILFDTSGNGKMYLDNGTDRLEMGGAITIDASLSKTSTNAIQNKAVTGNILNSLAEVSAATQQNTIAGALALKEVNNSLVANIYVGDDGKLHKVQGGADSVLPFNKNDLGIINVSTGGTHKIELGYKPTQLYIVRQAGNSIITWIYISALLTNQYYYNSGEITNFGTPPSTYNIFGLMLNSLDDSGFSVTINNSGVNINYYWVAIK